LVNDTTSNPDELLDLILAKTSPWDGTNYTAGLETVHKQLEDMWVTER
jgi:hypothetical protein